MRHTTLLSVAAVLSCAGLAHAQNALDRNLSTQTRINQRAPSLQDQMRFNNAVVNGTAPQGASFRGYVGYRAPDQFGTVGTRVPSDDLYNFRRDTYMSGVANTGVRGSDALRYQFGLTTGQYLPGFLASVPKLSSTATGANTTALRSTSDFLTQQTTRPALVGVREDSRGAEFVARASPLLGITWIKTAESPLATQAPEQARPQNEPVLPGNPPLQMPADLSAPGARPGAKPQPETANPTGVPTVEQRVGPGFTGMESSAPGVASVLDREGAALQTRVEGPTAVDTEQHAQIVTRVQQALPTPESKPEARPGAQPAAQPLTFQEQMERLQRMLRGEPEAAPNAEQPRVPQGTIAPETEQEKKEREKKQQQRQQYESGATTRPALPGDVNPPAEKAPGKPTKPGPRPADDQSMRVPGELTPEVLRALRAAGDAKLDHLVASGQPRAKGISNPTAYNANMREGEDFIASGKFFDAEERFVRALASAPDDPMASAGRINAEIGAGLYLSAAANLRALFAEHPEMVGTRYAARLLPGTERAKAISDLLFEQEKKAAGALSRETALLLAYLGYQLNDQHLINQGLDDLAARTPDDPSGEKDRALVQLLRGVWIAK